jgi:hypothetical protein
MNKTTKDVILNPSKIEPSQIESPYPTEGQEQSKRTLIPISYVLSEPTNDVITIRAMNFDSNNNPTSWGIYRGSSCMHKDDGLFEYEPQPSSRTHDWLLNHRFNSVEEAVKILDRYIK